MNMFTVAPCNTEAAKYAVTNWHYSRTLPAGKLIKYGVWENERFIGVVLFGRGATPNLLKPYGLDQTEGCELVRIALDKHATPVSQIVAQTIKELRSSNPRLRLIVSFADPFQKHHGGIYQAGNWVYAGKSAAAGFLRNKQTGQMIHPRSEQAAKTNGRNLAASKMHERIIVPGKHRYLYPLDKAMRRQIQSLAQPYPRGSSLKGETADSQSARPGSIPGNRSNS